MELTPGTSFEDTARNLEALARLQAQGLLSDSEFEELRAQALRTLKRALQAPEDPAPERPRSRVGSPSSELPYGLLHAQIVRALSAAPQEAEVTERERMIRAIATMAEAEALFPGDTAALTELVDIVCPSFPGSLADQNGEESRELLRRLRLLGDLAERMRASNASPAGKAIAETAHQSTARAAEEFESKQTLPTSSNAPMEGFWRKWVLNDVEGAYEGGAAAVTMAPILAADWSMTLPMIAALGVVVAAGVRSARAQMEP